jgi:ABC-type glutathione transport system ATPase component
MGPQAYRNPAAIRQFDAQYGFNRAWYIQYLIWLGHLLRGKVVLILVIALTSWLTTSRLVRGEALSVVRAIDGVSLHVQPGQCLGIVGEPGCGKTMTALSVMQLLPPGGYITGGRILLGDRDISALDDGQMRHVRGNQIGMIFQDPMTSLNPTMSIGDQIAETVLLHRGVGARAARARAVEVLGLMGCRGQPSARTVTRTSSPAACGSG